MISVELNISSTSREITFFKFQLGNILYVTFFRDSLEKPPSLYLSSLEDTHRAEKTIKQGLLLPFAWRHVFGQRAKRREEEREK